MVEVSGCDPPPERDSLEDDQLDIDEQLALQLAKIQEGRHNPENQELVNSYRRNLLRKLRSEHVVYDSDDFELREEKHTLTFCDPLIQGPSSPTHVYRAAPEKTHDLLKNAFRNRQLKLAKKKGRIVTGGKIMELAASERKVNNLVEQALTYYSHICFLLQAYAEEVYAESGAWDHLMDVRLLLYNSFTNFLPLLAYAAFCTQTVAQSHNTHSTHHKHHTTHTTHTTQYNAHYACTPALNTCVV